MNDSDYISQLERVNTNLHKECDKLTAQLLQAEQKVKSVLNYMKCNGVELNISQNHNEPGEPCDACRRPLTGGGGTGPTSCRRADCVLFDDTEDW